MACRNMKKCGAAQDNIKADLPDAKLNLVQLDLGDLGSVEAAASSLDEVQFDGLILNAGIMGPEYMLTKQGYEIQFGVNHLGHFHLTNLLLANMLMDSTITVVSSSANFRPSDFPRTIEEFNDKERYNAKGAMYWT
eukprot:UN01818